MAKKSLPESVGSPSSIRHGIFYVVVEKLTPVPAGTEDGLRGHSLHIRNTKYAIIPKGLYPLVTTLPPMLCP